MTNLNNVLQPGFALDFRRPLLGAITILLLLLDTKASLSWPTLAAALALCLTSPALMLGDEFSSIDGKTFRATLESISAGGEVGGQGIPGATKLSSLRSIVRRPVGTAAKGKIVAGLHDNGLLQLESLTLGNERFTAKLTDGVIVTLPLESVRNALFRPELVLDSFTTAAANPAADLDKIFVTVDQNVESVSGLITELTDDELRFEVDGKQQSFPRQRLHGIVLAQAAAPTSAAAVVVLAKSSRLAGKIAQLSKGQLDLEVLGGITVVIPLASVQRIDLRSALLTTLADLKPSEVHEEPFLTVAMPWQRNQSVGKKPLTLAGKIFESGLGVHARSSLSFAVPEGFDTFSATVGIDAETQGRGDCLARILGDGRELWSHQVKGNASPVDVQLSLRDVKTITLVVEPGIDFDWGDHLDWCDARFLRLESSVKP